MKVITLLFSCLLLCACSRVEESDSNANDTEISREKVPSIPVALEETTQDIKETTEEKLPPVLPKRTQAKDLRYYQRPLNCPLRYSSLSNLRNQVQTLVSSLGNGCTQNNQQALNQLNLSIANLEGIVNSFSSYSQSTGSRLSSNALYARNVGQILGGINIIASNNTCFYDVKARGLFPVLSDVIMSVSQLGLLVPTGAGQAVAAGGYIAGTGLKIINQLVKKRFNFDRPEERRAFIQLNCAFFDNRKVMEEAALFDPETEEFRDQLISNLKSEKLELIQDQTRFEKERIELEEGLREAVNKSPRALKKGFDPSLSRTYSKVLSALSVKPSSVPDKIRQVLFLSERAEFLLAGTRELTLDEKNEPSRRLLIITLERVVPELREGGRAWTNGIEEYETIIRGPLISFMSQVSAALEKELGLIDAEFSVVEPGQSKLLSNLQTKIRQNELDTWSTGMRLASIEAKIFSMEKPRQDKTFSDTDEGTSNEVELLDYYRTLQSSILGKQGRDFLNNSIKNAFNIRRGLEGQLKLLSEARTKKEICSAAEKVRFAWAQYRFKVNEAYDFVSTNLDLYRSSFRIGKERLGHSTWQVLFQIDSVIALSESRTPPEHTIGDLMLDVQRKLQGVESDLKATSCF